MAVKQSPALRRGSGSSHEVARRHGPPLSGPRLAEHVAAIQSGIIAGGGLDDLLDRIAAATRELLGDDLVGLRLVDETDRDQAILVASSGLPDSITGYSRSPIGDGAGGQAITKNRLVRIDDYPSAVPGMESFKSAGVSRAMAAPLHERGEVVGSLTTGRIGESAGRYRDSDEAVLLVLAGCASLALSNARLAQDAIDRAHSDPLTGLASRLMAEKSLVAALAGAESEGGEVSVLAIGLDGFGDVNEALGRSCGDRALVAAAARIAACVPPEATTARFGGDVFVAILDGLAASSVDSLAAAMIARLEEPFELGDDEVLLSASIGIASGGELGVDLMRDAEAAMRRAKRRGKAQSHRHDPASLHRTRARLSLERRLSVAIRDDELFLVHQPVVTLADRAIPACEALIRWRDPERGVLGPDAFIDVAEQGRLIFPLGRWVIAEACSQLARMRELSPGLRLHVNLSAAQLSDPELDDAIAGGLARNGLEPASLIFELTETAFILDEDLVTGRLEELKALGVKTAVDDFGTGNASLRHLARFPLDILKIDRSFVARILTDERQRAIARSITSLGRDLGLIVVAEGVETAAQAEFVTELGCSQGQGYHFARPAELDQITPLLASGRAPA
ncbi:EAL domain-containing protein [Thermoleophilia bacterium SCSIO 60948]|nr:EAL domain-containing protein [Thermoleophilia bacterium SCSIO 60948]